MGYDHKTVFQGKVPTRRKIDAGKLIELEIYKNSHDDLNIYKITGNVKGHDKNGKTKRIGNEKLLEYTMHKKKIIQDDEREDDIEDGSASEDDNDNDGCFLVFNINFYLAWRTFHKTNTS